MGLRLIDEAKSAGLHEKSNGLRAHLICPIQASLLFTQKIIRGDVEPDKIFFGLGLLPSSMDTFPRVCLDLVSSHVILLCT